MSVPVVVPDASVLLKWVLPAGDEEHYNQALKIKEAAVSGACIIKLPSLWLYEVGNTLARRFPKHVKNLLTTYLSFGMVERQWDGDWLLSCLSLVERYKVTFYDAAYHSLALVENGTFVTADKSYVRKTKEAGAVVLLQNWDME